MFGDSANGNDVSSWPQLTNKCIISYCYNKTSGDNYVQGEKGVTWWRVGGIIGFNWNTSEVKNCYVSNDSIIKCGNSTPSADIGTSSNYLGRIIGQNDGTSTNNSYCAPSSMPNVYSVVSKNTSNMWKNNSNDAWAPKLTWE